MFRRHLGAVALVAVLTLPFTAAAQTLPAPGAVAPTAPAAHHHRHHRNRFVAALRGLHLSDAQKQQIAGFLKTSRSANKDQTTADRQTRRARAQALHTQIEGVLTADQRTQLHAQFAREPRLERNPNAPAAPPATR